MVCQALTSRPPVVCAKGGGVLSSLLFNLVADVVIYILDKARAAGHIHGVVVHLIEVGGLTHL